jgi:hypothetical protein
MTGSVRGGLTASRRAILQAHAARKLGFGLRFTNLSAEGWAMLCKLPASVSVKGPDLAVSVIIFKNHPLSEVNLYALPVDGVRTLTGT